MITIEINNSGAAFDEPGIEIARLLRKLADVFEGGGLPFTLIDINGNKCGTVQSDSFGVDYAN